MIRFSVSEAELEKVSEQVCDHLLRTKKHLLGKNLTKRTNHQESPRSTIQHLQVVDGCNIL